MPLSRFHLEYHGVVSRAVFQPSGDYVSRNTIEFSRTIDGGVLSTARERTSRPPETLVYFSSNARPPYTCTLQLWHSIANKATCLVLDGANVLRIRKIIAEITIPRAESWCCYVDD